uniref:Uncharacterized protein n=1 Tax=Magallana gigas TaxID=29159 RepID=A0A8W8P3K6_MAGGI
MSARLTSNVVGLNAQSQPKKIETIDEMFPSQNPTYSCVEEGVFTFVLKITSEIDLALDQFPSNTTLQWILSPEAPVEKPPAPLLEDLLRSKSFLHAEDQDNWLRTQHKVTEDIINTTAEKTKGQRNNAVLAIVRKQRITASNFGQVLKAEFGYTSLEP